MSRTLASKSGSLVGACTPRTESHSPSSRSRGVRKTRICSSSACQASSEVTTPNTQKRSREKNRFTWAILKAHTLNTAGTVMLRSDDPRDVPHVNFRYFEEGNDASGDDLEAAVEGVEFVRRMMRRASEVVEKELVPGENVSTREQIRVRQERSLGPPCVMHLQDGTE